MSSAAKPTLCRTARRRVKAAAKKAALLAAAVSTPRGARTVPKLASAAESKSLSVARKPDVPPVESPFLGRVIIDALRAISLREWEDHWSDESSDEFDWHGPGTGFRC